MREEGMYKAAKVSAALIRQATGIKLRSEPNDAGKWACAVEVQRGRSLHQL
jgi:hypothetical protein